MDWREIWNDPVLSKVISAGILAAIGAAFAFVRRAVIKNWLAVIFKKTPPQNPDEPSLPTFEIGICTEGSPFDMQCTGEIIRGVDAATRVVEEIELYTKPSDKSRFQVHVTGMERIRRYLEGMHDARGDEVEIRHKLQMAFLDWTKHRDEFRAGVEFILWHAVFRKTGRIYNAKAAAETICGLAKNCFDLLPDPTLFLWYADERRTVEVFSVPAENETFTTTQSGAIDDLEPSVQRLNAFPQLIFVAKQKFEGASQVTLDKYLDVSKWRWSVRHPEKFRNLQ
jgi:hypothetical protein